MLDASRAVGVASRLLSETQREDLVEATAREYEQTREARLSKGASSLLPLAEARANAFRPDFTDKPPPPAQPGVHVFDEWDLADLRDCFDWTPFFRAWEIAGTYPPHS